MVEEMYQQELKETESTEERENNQSNNSNMSGNQAQTPSTPGAATTSTATTAAPPTITTTKPTGKKSDINATESDSSLVAINRQGFSENQGKHSTTTTTSTTLMASVSATTSEIAPPASQCFDSDLPPQRLMPTDDTCRLVTPDFGTTSAAADIGSTLIRFGTTVGDVSLTLGLRHAGNMPEKTPFSVRDFGAI